MILCRNMQQRRWLRWPVGAGAWISIPPGETFLVHSTDLDAPGVTAAMQALLREGIVVIEDVDLVPVVH